MEIKFLDERLSLDMLKPATSGSAGIDLYACIDDDIRLFQQEVHEIKTGIAINIEDRNIGALIIPRSGLGSKGLVLANVTGLIDSDYQGEIFIKALNRNKHENQIDTFNDWDETILIEPMQKIAQMFFVPVIHPVFMQVDDFSCTTKRGDGGFGSTDY